MFVDFWGMEEGDTVNVLHFAVYSFKFFLTECGCRQINYIAKCQKCM